MSSLKLWYTKVDAEALQNINDKMPKLQIMALFGVICAEGGELSFQELTVLFLGLSTPAKDIVMDLPKLEKLQLKMQCPQKLIITASSLRYVALNVDPLGRRQCNDEDAGGWMKLQLLFRSQAMMRKSPTMRGFS